MSSLVLGGAMVFDWRTPGLDLAHAVDESFHQMFT
jgi:hypothetical protein